MTAYGTTMSTDIAIFMDLCPISLKYVQQVPRRIVLAIIQPIMKERGAGFCDRAQKQCRPLLAIKDQCELIYM